MSNKQFLFLLFGILGGAVLGYFGNVVANRKNNELLVQLLKDALDCTNNEINNRIAEGRTSNDERLVFLNARRLQLETQLADYS